MEKPKGENKGVKKGREENKLVKKID